MRTCSAFAAGRASTSTGAISSVEWDGVGAALAASVTLQSCRHCHSLSLETHMSVWLGGNRRYFDEDVLQEADRVEMEPLGKHACLLPFPFLFGTAQEGWLWLGSLMGVRGVCPRGRLFTGPSTHGRLYTANGCCSGDITWYNTAAAGGRSAASTCVLHSPVHMQQTWQAETTRRRRHYKQKRRIIHTSAMATDTCTVQRSARARGSGTCGCVAHTSLRPVRITQHRVLTAEAVSQSRKGGCFGRLPHPAWPAGLPQPAWPTGSSGALPPTHDSDWDAPLEPRHKGDVLARPLRQGCSHCK